jgi:hypothetical protein
VEFTCKAFPPVLLKSLGVLPCQFLSGDKNAGEKFKERGRALPIDFDGNWPKMELRPTEAFLYGISVAPHSLGPALYSGVRMFTGYYLGFF